MRENAREGVVVPIVHLNGTSKEELAELRSNAWDALIAAYDRLKRMAPNGRDYYPVPGLMDKAVEQHHRRLLAMNQIMDELEVELEALA